ncbi:MAG: SRPBCC domain-containing protein [Rhodospirillaceae bacterium]
MKAIETEIDIRAEGSVVWDVLTDFPRYAEWNPFIPSASGDVRRGGRLRIRIAPVGLRHATFRPRIVTLQPGRELSWVGRVLLPGVFDGWHSFRLAETGSGVRFYQCERFTGLFSAFFGEDDIAAVRAGFEAMNTALRDRCEAMVAERRKAA